MFATAIIVFRESSKPALIVAVVLGASRGIAGRAAGSVPASAWGCWVGPGAVFADVITSAFSGNGQELLDAGILLAAVACWPGTTSG